jgi:membrane protein implicated in regulation of membrane protease activity
VSPTAKFLLFAILIAVIVTTIMYLLDIPLGWRYSGGASVVVISVLLYVFLAKIADRLRHKTLGS